MANRVVIDPVTRIEGHLRIEADIENGVVKDAFSSGTMIRGIELIVKDRDPRDAWAYVARVCGVCTSMHGLAGVRVVENALDMNIPFNAEQVRNLMLGALYIQDHLFHFYTLQSLDWIDPVAALQGDPAEAAEICSKISNWPKNSEADFATMKEKLQRFVDSGQLGFLSNGYWGHPAYKVPPTVSLIGITHYFQNFDEMRDVVRIQTIFGGKNPHPNFLVGGMASAINTNDPAAVNLERLSWVQKIIERAHMFVKEVHLPDVELILSYYPEWTKIGGGLKNYLVYGDFPMQRMDLPSSFKIPQGIVLNRDLSDIKIFNPNDMDGLQEFVSHAWYKYPQGKDVGLHPSVGVTDMDYTGPKTPYKNLDTDAAYSWIKTPRYKGMPMETGPLARMVVGYAHGNKDYVEMVDSTLARLNWPFEAIYSTAGRILSRAMETQLVSAWMQDFYNALLDNIKKGDQSIFNPEKWEPSSWPEEASGFSLSEAPRGALAHYASIRDKKISNYQMVMPTTWNASPRDNKDVRSAYEESLIGTPVNDAQAPVEILRTVHSFDPCLACAVHLYDEKGSYVHQVETK